MELTFLIFGLVVGITIIVWIVVLPFVLIYQSYKKRHCTHDYTVPYYLHHHRKQECTKCGFVIDRYHWKDNPKPIKVGINKLLAKIRKDVDYFEKDDPDWNKS